MYNVTCFSVLTVVKGTVSRLRCLIHWVNIQCQKCIFFAKENLTFAKNLLRLVTDKITVSCQTKIPPKIII